MLVVGAGMSGAACARALQHAGLSVTVRERGRAPGGRLAAPMLHGRRVDLGAAYFTVVDHDFGKVVGDWHDAGLVRKWTDTLAALSTDERTDKTGPMRWAAPDGLRSLVRDLLAALDVEFETELTSVADVEPEYAAVVLAMPDPQARRLLDGVGAADGVDWIDYEPVIAVAAGYPQRSWDLDAAAFVNGDPDITLIADDGARRGDGAPVLVVHTGAGLAARCAHDPDTAVEPALAAAARLLGIEAAPSWTHAHRWLFAKPADSHDASFALLEQAGPLLGLCGDSWCPSGAPRVESAWRSGHALGTELAARLFG